MRTIEYSSVFKRDFKKQGELTTSLIEILYKLLNDEELPEKYNDHALSGNWNGYRECHIKPITTSHTNLSLCRLFV